MRLRTASAILALLALYPASRIGQALLAPSSPPIQDGGAAGYAPSAEPSGAPADDTGAAPAHSSPAEPIEAARGADLRDPQGAPEGDLPVETVEVPEHAPQHEERIIVVARGDTLAGLLDDAGVGSAEAHAAIHRLARHIRPTAIRPGDELAIRLSTDPEPSLIEIEIEPEPGRVVRAYRTPDGSWADEETLTPRSRFLVKAEGVVDGGLFPAVTGAGVPAGMALSLIRILSHQVDFQRDLQPGDSFSILFDRIRADDGKILGHGQILHASLTLSGRTLEVWRHKNRQGDIGWYDGQGRSLRRSFLRTPLDGARISSGFGRRTHPILGYTRMHQGIDFAAPTGTPVYAAGDGVVASAKREGGYGLMVRINHANGVQTRYAHLSRFGRNIAAGRRVRQGTIIGHVGSTGMSTGPHLHYEVAVNGRTVDPARHVQPPVRLAGAELSAFRARQQRLTRLVSSFSDRNELALASD